MDESNKTAQALRPMYESHRSLHARDANRRAIHR